MSQWTQASAVVINADPGRIQCEDISPELAAQLVGNASGEKRREGIFFEEQRPSKASSARDRRSRARQSDADGLKKHGVVSPRKSLRKSFVSRKSFQKRGTKALALVSQVKTMFSVILRSAMQRLTATEHQRRCELLESCFWPAREVNPLLWLQSSSLPVGAVRDVPLPSTFTEKAYRQKPNARPSVAGAKQQGLATKMTFPIGIGMLGIPRHLLPKHLRRTAKSTARKEVQDDAGEDKDSDESTASDDDSDRESRPSSRASRKSRITTRSGTSVNQKPDAGVAARIETHRTAFEEALASAKLVQASVTAAKSEAHALEAALEKVKAKASIARLKERQQLQQMLATVSKNSGGSAKENSELAQLARQLVQLKEDELRLDTAHKDAERQNRLLWVELLSIEERLERKKMPPARVLPDIPATPRQVLPAIPATPRQASKKTAPVAKAAMALPAVATPRATTPRSSPPQFRESGSTPQRD